MIIDFTWAYFVSTLPFVIAWVLVFILSKRTRKEQLFLSLLLAPIGTISELLYFQDYWNPPSILSFNIGPVRILLEDFLFVFSVVGIGAVVYEAFFYKKLIKSRDKSIDKKLAFLVVAVIGAVVSFSLFSLGINSIYATSVGFIAAALFIISQRKDLFVDSLISGVAVMLTMFISYFILIVLVSNTEQLLKQGWLLYGTSMDLRFFGIPFTEMVWGFAWGMVVGPLYEFLKGYRTA